MSHPNVLRALIDAVATKSRHAFPINSLKQGQRIKYHFYAFRQRLRDAPGISITDAATLAICERIMVSINDKLTPPTMEFALRDSDDAVILKSFDAPEPPPAADQEAVFNRFLEEGKFFSSARELKDPGAV